MNKECVLYDRACIECGECDICDLDPNKKCDNCGKCLNEIEEYRTVYLDEFMEIQEERELVKKEKIKGKKDKEKK